MNSLGESFEDIFITKTSKDPESFYMSTSLSHLSKYENIIDIGYINTYRCNKIRDTGSYFIIINSKFSNAIFAISKTNIIDNGNINKLSHSGDDIDIIWNPGEYPFLQFVKNKNDDKYNKIKKLEFYIKVITSF
jgi:hypothetical protein